MIRLGTEICRANRSRSASVAEESQKHSRDVSALAGEVTTIPLRNHT